MNEEIGVRIVLFAVMAGTGAMLEWIARASARGELERNGFIGIRIPSTMSSDEAWEAGHRRAVVPMRLGGIAAFVTALVALVPMPEGALVAVVLAGTGVMTAFVLYAAVVAGRAAREVRVDEA